MTRIWYLLIVPSLILAKTDYSCYDFQFNPRVCLPGPMDIAEKHEVDVQPSLTCGAPSSGYCRSAKPSGCYVCNASSFENSHPVRYMTDKDYPLNYWNFGYKPTWWQSITWWDAKQRNLLQDNVLKVQLTLSMNKSYDLTGSFKVTFYSSLPHAFIIEKSLDFGNTWKAYRYYADQCSERFPGVPLINQIGSPRDVYCVEHQTVAAVQGSQVDFTPSYTPDDFWSRDTQEYLTATDFRISLEYPWTDNNELINQEQFLNKYYYDITDLQIHGRCHCNGHAPYCDSQKRCYCQHNTDGVDCEKCLPLFNNKQWKPAEASDKPNPCEACQCNNHADSCHYNATLGHGVCDSCNNGTSGYQCEQCDNFYYRNSSVSISHAKTCISCDCFLFGVTNNGKCLQNATSMEKAGQCMCKPNVHGRKCDECEKGYYGLRLANRTCQACNCSINGTINMDITCDQTTGQCSCKRTTQGLTCSSCVSGYYAFPDNKQGQCKECNCNVGGSYSQNCHQETGECSCRKGVTGRHCDQVSEGMYVPSFNYYLLEAESGIGSFQVTSKADSYGIEYTGYGYASIGIGDEIVLSFSPDFTSMFHVLLRHQRLYQNVQITFDISYTNDSVTFSMVPSLSITLDVGANKTVITSLILMHNGNYTIRVSNVSQTVLLDSVILMPEVKDSTFYRASNNSARDLTYGCWNESLIKRGMDVTSNCQMVLFSIATEWFNGTKECDCNPTGSLNMTCDQFGGQCHCKPGVIGLHCDQCMAGFFNFSIQGCQKCSCNMDGSKSFDCDRTSGQCACKQNVTSLNCDRCNDNFYGFGTPLGCRDCGCSVDGSSMLQCLDDGTCVCKSSTKGMKCNQCELNYFNFTLTGCSACGCDSRGSLDLQCHQETGICNCKQNIMQVKCGMCKQGYFNLDASNTNGCQACFCYNKTQICQSSSGFIIQPYQNDLYEWTMTSGGDSRITDRNVKFNMSSDVFKMSAPSKYLGNKLYLLYRRLAVDFQMILLRTGNKPRSFVLVITGGNGQTVSFQELNITSNVRYSKQVIMSPESTRLTKAQLQSFLLDIAKIELYFNGVPGDAGFFYSLAMDEAKLGGTGGTKFGGIEKCSCPMNYTGSSCQDCATGYTRPKISGGSWDDCVLCSCNNRSSNCDVNTGVCYDCQHGSEGDFCKRCQSNVKEPNCDGCVDGYYGFNDKSFVGCKACNCIAANTITNRTDICDSETGQCPCKTDIGGRRCGRCAENAANVSDVCQACGICHGFIQDEVLLLRSQFKLFKEVVGNATSSSVLLGNTTFIKLLANISDIVAKTLSKVNTSMELEQNLNQEILDLGESLDILEEKLDVNISNSVNLIRAQTSQIVNRQNRSTGAMDTIYNFLWMSVNVINADITPRINETSIKIEELQKIASNLSTIASQRMQTYAPILRDLTNLLNKTAYIIESTSDLSKTSLDVGRQTNEIEASLNDLSSAAVSQESLSSRLLNQSMDFFSASTALLKNITSTGEEIKNLNITNVEELSQTIKQRQRMVASEFSALRNESEQIRVMFSDVYNSTIVFFNLSSKALKDVNATNETISRIHEQVKLVEQRVQNASTMANITFQTAQKMLLVLMNYEEAISNSSSALNNSMEQLTKLNESNSDLLNFATRMKVDTGEIFQNATKVYNGVVGLKNLSLQQREKTLQVLEIMNNLARKRVLKTNITEIEVMFRNINEIGYRGYELKIRCANFTNSTLQVIKDTSSSMRWASEAKQDQEKQRQDLETLKGELQSVQEIDTSHLTELQNSLGQSRTKFDQMKLTNVLNQLRNARDELSNKVSDRKKEISMLRGEIKQLRELYSSMKSAKGCGLG